MKYLEDIKTKEFWILVGTLLSIFAVMELLYLVFGMYPDVKNVGGYW